MQKYSPLFYFAISSTNYKDVSFTIFETRQLKEFMNLQLGKNTIMVSVESGLEKYIFQFLFEKYSRNVLLKPSIDLLWTYLQDDTIIINKLLSETPKNKDVKWMSKPEKFLVDIIADKILGSLIPPSQLEYIFDGYLNNYLIDVKKMVRYARRRSCDERLLEYVDRYMDK